MTSFLVPVRDGAETLPEALAGVFAQTDRDFEVVVVDDGSTDDSAEIAEAAGATVIRTAPLGIVNALNTGLRACRGAYVARMDADDRCSPDRLALQIPVLEREPRIAVVDGRIDGGGCAEGMARLIHWMNGILEPEDFDRELLVESPIAHPAATYRRDVVLAHGGYRHGPFPEDYDLWLRLHAAGWRFRKVPEVVVTWRDRPGRLTRSDPRYARDALRTARQGWLRATVLARPRRIVVWGAGKEGKPWLKWLRAEGHDVVCAIDVHPRRVVRAGVPVRPPSALAGLDAEVCLVAVGARGAREEIRAELTRLRPDWREGEHWWAVR